MAVLKTSFRFPEINLGFATSARGAGHLTPKKSLGRGAFDQGKGPHGGEFDQKKCQMPGGDMGTLGFDLYIRDQGNITIPNGSRFPVYPVQQSWICSQQQGSSRGLILDTTSPGRVNSQHWIKGFVNSRE